MATGQQPRDEDTNSQPPNDPMGFGGKERQAGYGKYQPGSKDDQASGGVPGAFGDGMDPPEASRDVAKGDEVSDEMGHNHLSEMDGREQAMKGQSAKKAA